MFRETEGIGAAFPIRGDAGLWIEENDAAGDAYTAGGPGARRTARVHASPVRLAHWATMAAFRFDGAPKGG